MMLTRFFGCNRSWSEGLAITPFAIFSGLAFVVPYALAGIFLGPEFPSIVGALIGLAIVVPAARAGFLTPKQHWDFPAIKDWPTKWIGSVEIPLGNLAARPTMTIVSAWLPYALLAVLLMLSRINTDVKAFLSHQLALNWTDILDEKGISGSIPFLYLSGSIMVFVVLVTFFLHRMQYSALKAALGESSRTLLGAGFVLIFTVPMVRILINSGDNLADLPAMPQVMAQWIANSMGDIYPFFAPSVGALGAFIAGSNTVSNLMMTQFQFDTAQLLNVSSALLVSLQAVGAAAGNMIAIHNVVAASAIAGLLGREGSIIRMTIIPTLYYLIAVGIIALIAIHGLGITDPLL
jgi:lactate permease